MERMTLFFSVALLPPLTVVAQQLHPNQQPSQQLSPASAYVYQAIAFTGMNLNGFNFTDNTNLDAIAFSDTGEAAFIVHAQDGTGEHSWVLTSRRVIASDREVIGGKTIVRVTGPTLSINNPGEVAFEALYTDPTTTDGPHTGVFAGRHFAFDLGHAAAPDDFTLSDAGVVTSREGLRYPALPAPASATAQASPNPVKPAAPASANPSTPKSHNPFHLSPTVLAAINKHSPITVDSDPVQNLPGIGSTPPPARTATSPPPTAQPPQGRPAATPLPPPPPVRPSAPCPLPAFPMPAEWQMGGDGSGPITSHAFDGAGGRVYDSPVYGKLKTPIRSVQYASDCRAILVIIGDSAARGRFELWTASGLVTYQSPDGSWVFPGFAGKVTSGAFAHTETSIRINKRGQLLIPVNLAHGCALLLGNPVEGSR
jgi:hypothetical protein